MKYPDTIYTVAQAINSFATHQKAEMLSD